MWNAFEDSIGNLTLNANVKAEKPTARETHNLSSTADQYLGFRDLEVCAFSSNIFQTVDLHLFILKQSDLQDSCIDGIQRDAAYFPPLPTKQSHVMGPSYAQISSNIFKLHFRGPQR